MKKALVAVFSAVVLTVVVLGVKRQATTEASLRVGGTPNLDSQHRSLFLFGRGDVTVDSPLDGAVVTDLENVDLVVS